MTRRIALSIAFIGFNLMACCCGGAPRQRPDPVTAEPVAKLKSPDQKPVSKPAPKEDTEPEPLDQKPKLKVKPAPKEELKKEADSVKVAPDPPVYPDPPVAPAAHPKFTPVTIAQIGNAKVELLSGSIGKAAFMRRTINGLKRLETEGDRLVLKVRVTNAGKAFTYAPWHASPDGTMGGIDERKERLAPWYPGTVSWPVGGIEKAIPIASNGLAEDFVCFHPPGFDAEEIDIYLPGKNCEQAKPFTFKIGRAFFEDESQRKADVAASFQKKLQDHARLVAGMKQDHKDLVKRLEAEHANKIERDRLDKINDDRRAKVAAEVEAEKARSRGVSRANYNKVTTRMIIKDVEDILGPGRESSRGGGLMTATWKDGSCVIAITFEGVRLVDGSSTYMVVSKSIFGD